MLHVVHKNKLKIFLGWVWKLFLGTFIINNKKIEKKNDENDETIKTKIKINI